MSEPPGQRLIAPDDEHNRKLVANVHPLDWVNPDDTTSREVTQGNRYSAYRGRSSTVMQKLLGNRLALWGGAIVTLICCFTPVLVVLFGLVGLGAAVGYLDYALMVLLGFFITALSRFHSWQGNRRVAWSTGGAALLAFAIYFGRFTLVFPALIAVGGVIAFLAYRTGDKR